MSICKKCGRSVSVLGMGLGLGPQFGQCPDCRKAGLVEAARERTKDSFPCLVPNSPVTATEKLAVAALVDGNVQGAFRTAWIRATEGQLEAFVFDSPGGRSVIGTWAVARGDAVTASPGSLSVGQQWRAGLPRILLTMGVAGLIVYWKTSGARPSSSGEALARLCAVLGVMLFVGLIQALPVAFKARRAVPVMQVTVASGKPFGFLLRPESLSAATQELERIGLKVTVSGPRPHLLGAGGTAS